MKGTQRYISLLGIAAAFGATMIAPTTASAESIARQTNKQIMVASTNHAGHSCWTRRNHRSYRRHAIHRYFYRTYSTNTSGQGFPNYYPNIQYFRQNGHIYYRNLDTGEVFLSQW